MSSSRLASASPPATEQDPSGVLVAAHSPRIAIESVQPALEHGRFAAKATVNEPVRVSAVIFADGHDVLAAAVCWYDDQGTQHRAVSYTHLTLPTTPYV